MFIMLYLLILLQKSFKILFKIAVGVGGGGDETELLLPWFH